MKNKHSALWLSGIIILIFIIQVLIPSFTDLFILKSSGALKNPWTLITSTFLHGSIVHLLYNLFALALFGSILENIIGTKKFLLIYSISGLVASLFSIPFYNSVLGASGAIFGIIGALAIINPKMVVWVFGFPMRMYLALIIWVLIDIFGIIFPTNTANIAHLSGVLIGVISGFILRSSRITKNKDSIEINNETLEEWEDRYMR